MAVELVKEDGTGKADANAYATVAEADAYALNRPYATAWADKTADDKARFLIMATTMIDTLFQFSGYKSSSAQALQWPRTQAPNPDVQGAGAWRNPLAGGGGSYFSINQIPAAILRATCEQAFQLSLADRTGDAANAGLRSLEIVEAIKIVFDSATEQSPAIPNLVQQMLARIGVYQNSRGGSVKLQRT